MNTLFCFYCTCYKNNAFSKEIFTVIDSNSDFDDVIDGISEYILQELGATIIFDYYKVSSKHTSDDIQQPIHVKSIGGNLLFEDDPNQTILRIKSTAYDLQQKIKRKRVKKSAVTEVRSSLSESVWINRSGKQFIVQTAGHADWASEWLKEHNPNWRYLDENSGKCSSDVLVDYGWIRVLGWTSPVSFVVPHSITPRMKETLREYCFRNKVDYSNYPPILKLK